MKSISNPLSKFNSLKSLPINDRDSMIKVYEELLGMDISTEDKILYFQERRDEVDKHFVNEWCESHFLMTTDVSNETNKSRKEHFNQVIQPLNTEYEEKLNKKFIEAPASQKLPPPFNIFRRNLVNKLEIFNKENIEVNKKIEKLCNEITEIRAKRKAKWNGTEIPLPQMDEHLKSADREIRKKAYESYFEAELKDAATIDEKFDKLLTYRHELAQNAGFNNYTEYRFKEMQRFDWDQSDCLKFHNAVKKYIVPLNEKLINKKKSNLKLESYRPYDVSVDHNGLEPLKIYEKGDSASMVAGTAKIMKAIDEELYNMFVTVRDNNLLDLDSRENKAPGGYMVCYPVYEKASVFYNGTGLSYDLTVLLHELGHCFHYFLSKHITPSQLQDCTPEVAESGSMSMEYIGLENLRHYLGEEECKRIKSDRLRSTVNLFIMCAQGDEFQHWLYSNPGHTSQMRQDKWKQLNKEYNPAINYDDYEDQNAKCAWQFIHILNLPFYLIDYAISELLALTVWDKYKKSPAEGIRYYKNGCSLGASKTVPEIYEAFGTKLSFGEDVIAPLAKRLESELEIK